MSDVLYSHVEDTIQHYGIKGMKWGVRRTAAQLAKASRKARGKTEEEDYSDDARKARDSRVKANKKGIASLSNKELQDLNNRLNLEQNYSRLTTKPKPDVMKYIDNTVKTGKKANEVYQLAQSDFGQVAQKKLFKGKVIVPPKDNKK